MKILIIGLGGIGSALVGEIADLQFKGVLPANHKYDIADPDIVEVKNLMWQNYSEKDLGENKANATFQKYRLFKPIPKKIVSMKGYDLIICCADNMPTRIKMLESQIPFIDLRAEGRLVFACQGPRPDYQTTLDYQDVGSASCQTDNTINYGYKIAAMIGAQMLLNYTRGINNPKIVTRI